MSYHNHRIKFVSFDRIIPVIAVANIKNNLFALKLPVNISPVFVSSEFMSSHSYN